MARVGNFARDVELVVDHMLSPEARQKIVAKEARRILGEAQAANARVFGEAPEYTQAVDGRLGAPLESVNPDHGKIVFEFSLIGPVLELIGEQLVLHSPVLTGRYRDSHILLADGVEVDVDAGDKVPKAERYIFVNVQPYARKLEGDSIAGVSAMSDQAPDGIYEVVADMARRRFGNIANVKFTYVQATGGDTPLEKWAVGHSAGEEGAAKQRRQYAKDIRNPAIVVVPR